MGYGRLACLLYANMDHVSNMTASDLVTRSKAAEYLRRSQTGFDRLRIPRVVIDGRPLFLKSDLDQFIQSKRTTPETASTPTFRTETSEGGSDHEIGF
jgi:hypothetical protein